MTLRPVWVHLVVSREKSFSSPVKVQEIRQPFRVVVPVFTTLPSATKPEGKLWTVGKLTEQDAEAAFAGAGAATTAAAASVAAAIQAPRRVKPVSRYRRAIPSPFAGQGVSPRPIR
ncbi:hypothetical protein Mame01_59840 [Microbispora amethystogenes]|nr:hypothetical protein Mame01_59840 [Microbispora amethystogenes]